MTSSKIRHRRATLPVALDLATPHPHMPQSSGQHSCGIMTIRELETACSSV
jgi:hypothetical protein